MGWFCVVMQSFIKSCLCEELKSKRLHDCISLHPTRLFQLIDINTSFRINKLVLGFHPTPVHDWNYDSIKLVTDLSRAQALRYSYHIHSHRQLNKHRTSLVLPSQKRTQTELLCLSTHRKRYVVICPPSWSVTASQWVRSLGRPQAILNLIMIGQTTNMLMTSLFLRYKKIQFYNKIFDFMHCKM